MQTSRPLTPLFGSRANLAILLAIIAAGIALRLLYYHGIWGTDDAEYARLASAMARGNFIEYVNRNFVESFTGPVHIPYRVGLIFPLSVIFRLFGVSEPTLVFYPLLMSILVIVLAYVCGRMMFSPGAGLIAAALWAFMPHDITRANAYLPDIASSFYASLGATVMLYFLYSGIKKGSRVIAGGFLAGLIFGVAWLSKETVIYMAPLVLILLFMMLRRDPLTGLSFAVAMAVASAGVMAAEMTAYHLINGDFMSHFHGTEKSYLQTKSYLFYEGSRFGWPAGGSRAQALIKRLFIEGPQRIFLNPLYLYLPFFGIIAWGRSLYLQRSMSFNLAGLWMVSLAFMFNFASCSTSTYTPLVLSHRYLHPIMLPASLLLSGLIVQLLYGSDTGNSGKKATTFWGALISIVMILLVSYGGINLLRDKNGHKVYYTTRHTSRLIKPSDLVYTDPLTAKSLEFYWKYPEGMNIVNFEGMRPDEVRQGSFVLIDRKRVEWLKVNVDMWLTHDYGYKEPEFYNNHPAAWKAVWKGGETVLYRVE